jgi:anti-sigma-K factor RskA
MNCSEAGELLAAYALDALSAEEAAEVRKHIATCASHAGEVAELRSIASGLALLATPVTPPASLRDRTMQTVAQTAQEPPAAKVRTLRPQSRLQWGPSSRSFFPSPAWGALAAVVVAAIGGLLVWNAILLSDDDGGDPARLATSVTAVEPVTVSEGAPGGGYVLYFGEQRRAVFIGEDMPALSDDETYQLWSVAGEVPESIGLMEPDANGRGTAVVPYDADAATVLAVTIEPAGGSDQPTTNPIYVVEL